MEEKESRIDRAAKGTIKRADRTVRREEHSLSKKTVRNTAQRARGKRKRRLRRMFNTGLTVLNLILLIVVLTVLVKNLCTYRKVRDFMSSMETFMNGRDEDRDGIRQPEYTIKMEKTGSTQKTEVVPVKEAKLQEFAGLFEDMALEAGHFTVCLDPGHGGTDTGAEGSDGSFEKDQNLLLAGMVRQYLESVGIKVVMTRTEDQTVSLAERKELAQASGADLFLSLHRNVYEGAEEVRGVEAWIHSGRPADSEAAAKRIIESLIQEVGSFENRGVKTGTMDNPYEDYAVNKTLVTSLILEVGFITSKQDNQLFEKETEEIAFGIARGVAEGFCS